MSFASYEFLFTFLPVVILAAALTAVKGWGKLLTPVILVSSLAFYAQASIPHLILLLTLIFVTWCVSHLYIRTAQDRVKSSLIYLGVFTNLSALLLWKYSASIIDMWNGIGWIQVKDLGFILPLGISFYSLQQIGYLLDLRRGKTQPVSIFKYSAFVLFFPQLLAGPIVTHRRMQREFGRVDTGIAPHERLNMAILGIAWFTIGLFKKTVIADSLARLTIPLITKATFGDFTFWDAWTIALASGPRIYFDFCGYSDMAVGLGLLFGIRLPANFNAPFRTKTNREGWTRWHITFHHFIRDHVYIPLRKRMGHNPLGAAITLFIVFSISALWHGDSFEFILWGLIAWVSFLILNAVKYLFPVKSRSYVETSGRVGLLILLPLIFVIPDFDVVINVSLKLFSIPDEFPNHIKDMAIVIGLIFLLVAWRQEISTQTLLNQNKNHPERSFFGLRPPLWAPNIIWATFLAILLSVSFYFAGLSAPFVYFQF